MANAAFKYTSPPTAATTFSSVCFFYMLYCTYLLVAESLPDALVVVLGGGVVQVLHLVHPQEGHLPQELVLPKNQGKKIRGNITFSLY